jgi:prepilin-type N-terminal cleavage/methylation domain-containing protein
MKRMNAQKREAAERKHGFTLLELLISIGLTAILMVALFSAMNIYFRLQVDSHEEITRQQVSRALLRQMTRDIQSIVFIKEKATEDSTTSTSSMSSTSTGSTSNTDDSGTTAAMLTYTNGLVGTANDLLLYVSSPDKSLSYVDAQSLTSTDERTGDLMIVRYLVADTAGGGLSGSIAKKLAGSRTGPVGLVRITGDLFGMSSAVQLGKEEEFTSVDAVEAKEVSKIEFRYFDGTQWQETWDSTELKALPTAIEIVITLQQPDTSENQGSADTSDPYALGETTHRTIVALPLAESSAGETAL